MRKPRVIDRAVELEKIECFLASGRAIRVENPPDERPAIPARPTSFDWRGNFSIPRPKIRSK